MRASGYDELAQAAELDAQARAMRVVGAARAERALDQHASVDVAGPRLAERPRQREQHRPARERQPRRAGAKAAAARVDDERARGEQRFDVVETQRLLAA